MRDAWEIVKKEFVCDMRSRTGLGTGVLFAVSSAVSLGLAGSKFEASASVIAGLTWAAVLFTSVVAVSRTFIAEEEAKTADLLRVFGRMSAVFWGKVVYASAVMICLGFLQAGLVLVLLSGSVADPLMFIASLASGCCTLAVGLTVCSSMAARAGGGAGLAGVMAIPLLLFVLAPGIAALRASLGDPLPNAWASVVALVGFGSALCAAGPYAYAAAWKS